MIVLAGAVLFGLRIYSQELTEIAFVPDAEFVEQAPLEVNAYEGNALWFARPSLARENDPVRWQPKFAQTEETELRVVDPEDIPEGEASEDGATNAPPPQEEASEAETAPQFAVFFVHPTSFFDNDSWNAPIEDEQSQNRAFLMVRGMASAFNGASEIWVPRYRQATFGAFLTDEPEAGQALDAAYADIEQAFAVFLENTPEDMPIVLAGHSQGSLHISRLLKEHIAGTPLQARIAAAYPIGWPLSLEHDVPLLGLPACQSADQAGCITSWASFAEPAEADWFFERYAASPGFDGELRGDSPILCVNPLTGEQNGTAPMELNLGTLVPNAGLTDGELIPEAVPARCDETGLLMIGDPPNLGGYVLPGNNYHVYDIPLFWSNLQADVIRRIANWGEEPS